ncbi:unnamed protein product [Natator depressus]
MLDCQVWNILTQFKGFQKKTGPYFCPIQNGQKQFHCLKLFLRHTPKSMQHNLNPGLSILHASCTLPFTKLHPSSTNSCRSFVSWNRGSLVEDMMKSCYH